MTREPGAVMAETRLVVEHREHLRRLLVEAAQYERPRPSHLDQDDQGNGPGSDRGSHKRNSFPERSVVSAPHTAKAATRGVARHHDQPKARWPDWPRAIRPVPARPVQVRVARTSGAAA